MDDMVNAEVEAGGVMWNTPGWSVQNELAGLRYQQQERENEMRRRLGVLSQVALLDYDGAASREQLNEAGFSYYSNTPQSAGRLATYGRDIVSTVGDGVNPLDYAQEVIGRLKDEGLRTSYAQRLEQLKADGAWEQDYYALVGEMFRNEVQADYQRQKAEHEAKVARIQKGREAMWETLTREGPKAILEGAELSLDAAGLLNEDDEARRVLDAYRLSQQAGALVMSRLQDGRSKEEQDAAIEARVQELRQADAWSNAANAGFGVQVQRSDEELYQQARHEESQSYHLGVTRGFLADVADALRGDDGKVDELALGFLYEAMRMKAENEQSMDSKFFRNMFMEVGRMGERTLDEMNRGNAKNGMIYQGPDMPVIYLNEQQRAQMQREYSPDVEKLRSRFQGFEDTRLETSDKASWLAKGLSDIGTMAGTALPYVAAGPLWGTFITMPQSVNRQVGAAYEQGAVSPELRGVIKGAAQGAAEGLFGATLGKMPGYTRLIDGLAMRAVSLPYVGRVVGRWQGSALGRFVGSAFGESLGELAVEDLVADGVSWTTINGLRRLGVPLDEEVFKGLRDRLSELDLTERQTASTIAFCVVMGLTGAPAQLRAARDFAKNRDLLEAAGLRKETAAAISGAALTGRVSEGRLRSMCVASFQKEVLEDPVGARYRLADNEKKLMSDMEAEAMRREHVLEASLREAGIVSKEPASVAGKFRVQIVDAVKLEADKASWENGQRPEGYETPTKEVEFTGEQLAAYAQYHLSEREVKRMRAIRSAAFGKGAAQGLENVIGLSSLGAPALDALAKSEGSMTLPVLKALAGLAGEAAAEGRQLVQGVSNRALMGLVADFERRMDEAVTLGELTPEEREAAREGGRPLGAAAVRLTGEDGRSRILINDGLSTARGLTEDVLEGFFRDEVNALGGEESEAGRAFVRELAGDLSAARAQILEATGKEVMPEFDPEAVELSTLTEIFSHFAQSEFYQTADKRGLKGEALMAAQVMDAALMSGSYAQAMKEGYAKFLATEAGQAFVEKGGALSSLMEKAGLTLRSIYEQAEVTAENLAAVMEARAIARGAAEASVEEVSAMAAEARVEMERAALMSAPSLEPEESASPDVSTAELAEMFEQERAPLDEEGRIKPLPAAPVEVNEEGAGRGLKGGEFVRMGDGSVMGSARVEDIHLSPDVPRFARGGAGAERGDRFRADEAGYLTVWRRRDGRLELISGQRRLELAKADGVQDIAVRVHDEDAEHGNKWARLCNAELNIVDKSAGVEQVAYFFRETGMTDAGAEMRGLMPKKLDGEPLATMSMGKAIARQTPAGVFEDFMRGALTGEQAYFVATLGVADAAKAEAARMLMEGKDFDEVKAQMPGGGASFSLALDNGVGAFQNAMDVREEVMERMLNSVKKAAQQWAAPFKGTADDRTKARGSTLGMMMGVYRRLPQGYRLHVTPLLKRAAVLERMIATGKLTSHGQVSKEELTELTDAVLEQLDEDWASKLGEAEVTVHRDKDGKEVARITEAERKRLWKEAMQEATAKVGREGMEGVYRELAAEVQRVMEQYLHDMEMARLGKMLEGFAPKVNPATRKLNKGKYGATFYKEVEVLQGLMGASAELRNERMKELNEVIEEMEARGELTPEEQAERERADAELADWMTFAALPSRGFKDVRAARLLLADRAANARDFWEQRLNLTRAKLEAVAARFLDEAGPLDENALKKQIETFRRRWADKVGDIFNSTMSAGQLLYTLEAVPGLKGFAMESVRRVAQGNINIARRASEQKRAMDEFLEEILGLSTEAARNDFGVELNKLHTTGIRNPGRMVTRRRRYTIAEAEEWLAMTPEQREAARDAWKKDPDGKLQPLPEWATDALRAAYAENMTGDAAWARKQAAAEARRMAGKPGKVTRTPHVPKASFVVEASRREEGVGTLELSKNQALNIILLCEQPRYKGNAELQGFTEEVVQQLRDFVGREALMFGYWMRDYMGSTGLAEVFEAREGVPFPAEENYWTGRFDLSAKMDLGVDALDVSGGGFGGRYSMLKTRVDHNLSFDLTLGATNVFLGTMAMQNNYICMGELTQEWRRLLANQDFARALRLKVGESRFRKLKEAINILDMQGLAEATAQQSASWLIGVAQAARATALLSAAPVTMLKQGSAVVHAVSSPGFNLLTLLGEIPGVRRDKGRMKLADMLRQEAFASRMVHNKAKYDVFSQLLSMGPDATYSKLAAVSRFGMDGLDWMDVRANAVSATALYNATWRRLEAANKERSGAMTEEQMHAACMQQVEVMLDQSMMPTLKGQQSIGRVLGGSAAKALFFMQGELLNKMGLMVREYHRNGAGRKGVFLGAGKIVWSMSVAEMSLAMLVDLMRGPTDDEELDFSWALGHLVTGFSGLGFLQTAPLVGDLFAGFVQLISKAWGGERRRFVRTDTFASAIGVDVTSRLPRLWRWMTDGKERSVEENFKNVQDAARLLAAFGGLSGGVNSTFKLWSEVNGLLQSANALLNVARPVVEGVDYYAD